MIPNSTPRGRSYITPLCQLDLFEPGQVFPRDELVRRVLSVFWRNCCGLPGVTRAPAPVVELAGEPQPDREDRPRVGAWWLLYDGIVAEGERPESERLALFFGEDGSGGQLWPRYEFEISAMPFVVEMRFHENPGVSWCSCVGLELTPNALVRVVRRAIPRSMNRTKARPPTVAGTCDFDLGAGDVGGHKLWKTRT